MDLTMHNLEACLRFQDLAEGEIFVADGYPYPSKKTGPKTHEPLCSSDGSACQMALSIPPNHPVRRVAALEVHVE